MVREIKGALKGLLLRFLGLDNVGWEIRDLKTRVGRLTASNDALIAALTKKATKVPAGANGVPSWRDIQIQTINLLEDNDGVQG